MNEKHDPKQSDSDLIEAIQKGDRAAYNKIVEKYTALVILNSKRFFIPGGEFQDAIQEGMIGLIKAVKTYNPSSGRSFYQFANLCIARSLKSAVKASLRKKHIPLNNYIPFGNTELQGNRMSDPVDRLIDKELIAEINSFISNNLTPFEKEVFDLYTNGYSYADISDRLGISRKSVDNAVYRIRSKIKSSLT